MKKKKRKVERLYDYPHIGPKLDAMYDTIRRQELAGIYALQGGTVRALDQKRFGEYVKRDPNLQYLFGATNLTPIEGVLGFVEEPHTPSNTITNTKPIILRSSNMGEKIKTLIGKPIHISEGFEGHYDYDENGNESYTTIGVVLGAYYSEDQGKKTIRYIGGLHELDFPDEVKQVVEDDGVLGNSYETLAPVSAIRETKNAVIIDDYDFTGLAILRKDMAAFPETGVRLIAVKQKKDETVKAEKWSTAYINSLPDSAFLLVHRPVKNKAKDRALPVYDKNGKLDADHVRNALARINQVKGFSKEEVAKAKKKLIRLAKKLGISVSATNSGGKDNMSEDIKVLQEKVEEFERIVSEKDSKIEALSQQVEELKEAKEEVTSLKAELDTLREKIEEDDDAEDDDEVAVLQSELEKIKSELSEATEAKKSLEQEIADMKAEKAAAEQWEEIKDSYEEDAKEAVIAALKKSELSIPLDAKDVAALTSKKEDGLIRGQNISTGGELSEEEKAKMRARYGIRSTKGGSK